MRSPRPPVRRISPRTPLPIHDPLSERPGGAARRDGRPAHGRRRARPWPIALLVPTLAALLLGAPATAGAATACPGADATVTQIGADAALRALLCLTNHERTAVGLPALRTDARLAVAAQRHAADMTNRGFFAHDAPLPAPFGVEPGARALAAGYVWGALAENLAVAQQTPRWAIRDWLASAGHCRNLLWPQVTDIGLGVSNAPLGSYPAPTWVQELGRPLVATTPKAATPSCPRAPAVPAPADGPAPASEVAAADALARPAASVPSAAPDPDPGASDDAGVAPPAESGTAEPAPPVSVRATRRGRQLTLRLRRGQRTHARLLVVVRQGTLRRRLRVPATTGTHRLRLPVARGGTVVVGSGGSRRSIRFR